MRELQPRRRRRRGLVQRPGRDQARAPRSASISSAIFAHRKAVVGGKVGVVVGMVDDRAAAWRQNRRAARSGKRMPPLAPSGSADLRLRSARNRCTSAVRQGTQQGSLLWTSVATASVGARPSPSTNRSVLAHRRADDARLSDDAAARPGRHGGGRPVRRRRAARRPGGRRASSSTSSSPPSISCAPAPPASSRRLSGAATTPEEQAVFWRAVADRRGRRHRACRCWRRWSSLAGAVVHRRRAARQRRRWTPMSASGCSARRSRSLNYAILGYVLGRGEGRLGLLLQLVLNGVNIALCDPARPASRLGRRRRRLGHGLRRGRRPCCSACAIVCPALRQRAAAAGAPRSSTRGAAGA